VLGAQELQVVKSALDAAVGGAFFPDWEFETLFGLSRNAVRAVADRWPENLRDAVTETIAFNALTNLVGYPHKMEGDLAKYGLSVKTLESVLDKLRAADL
jgi:hypothetical protein